METRQFKVRRIIRLDGEEMVDRETAHRYLKERFYFPEHYGNNLDALYDLLTESAEPQRVIVYNVDALKRSLQDYGRSLLKVFRAAEEASGTLDVLFYEGLKEWNREYRVRIEEEEVDETESMDDYEPPVEIQE